MHVNEASHHRPHPSRPPRKWLRRWPWLAAAPLAGCLTALCASAAIGGTAASSPTPQLNCGVAEGAPASCYSPREYQTAYGVAALLRRGIDGRGQTVALLELAQAPASPGASDIRKDLAAFDSKFGLPRASLHVVNIAGSATPYLAGNQELGDAEMVHAFAPGATLDIVLVPAGATTSPASFAAGITTAVQESTALHTAVISISLSVGEHFLTRAEAAAMNQALDQARDQHVTVVASSGARGAISSHPAGPPVQVSLPASDPLVLGVGGTILDATPDGSYLGEMAWNDNTEASGGGYSSLFPRPSYQDGLARARTTRGVPDVAANADSYAPMAIEYGDGELRPDTGTSSATALWAGVIALADQQAGHPLGYVNPAIYAIAQGPAYHQAFHDVITGDNSVIWSTGVFAGYNAGSGWDPVTGWGSPDAQYLVPLLARTASSGT